MSNVIFINETDNIYEQLGAKGINCSKFPEIKNLYTKMLNNRIGYFKIKIEGSYYKICILPKIINKGDPSLLKDFSQYFNIALELTFKYKVDNRYFINDNYIDLLNISRLGAMEKLDYFLEYKYNVALKCIENFFKDYNKFSYIQNNYSDLNIKSKIDIRKNILEINKTKIHQIGKEEISYSQIANITLSVLKYFNNFKIKLVDDNCRLQLQLHNVIKIINKKFLIKSFYYSIDRVLSDKVSNFFNNPKLQQLYMSIMILLDLEGYFELYKGYLEYNKVYSIPSIVIDPSLIFEYYVYDYYNKHPEKYKNVRFIRIDKDVKVTIRHLKKVILRQEETLESYTYNSEFIESKDQWVENLGKSWTNKDSKPDLVIKELDNNNILHDVVLDCKWKKLDKDIDGDDIEKLKRDCLAREINRGKLVYPKITTGKFGGCTSFEQADNRFSDGIFYLTIEECRML